MKHDLIKPKMRPIRTMRDKRALDDHLLRWSLLYVILVFVALYGYEYLYRDVQPGMNTEVRIAAPDCRAKLFLRVASTADEAAGRCDLTKGTTK